MSILRLSPRRVEKVWGRRNLWRGFNDATSDQGPVGEIWFDDPRDGDPELLLKYLFTGERLSIQVHPGDSLARQQGMARGKDEAWVILEAEPQSTIAIGPKHVVSAATLRAAARNGSIEQLLDWRSAHSGDVFYSPAGTIHAIGPGLTLIEVQQNCDTTYRLYDYGRPRELHLNEAVAAAITAPYVPFKEFQISEGRTVHVQGPAFVLERLLGQQELALDVAGSVWVIPVSGRGTVESEPLFPGGIWVVEGGGASLHLDSSGEVLLAYTGSKVMGGAA